MFYAIREQQITDTITERQLLKFYTKEDRVAYLEARSYAKPISAKEAHKFSLSAPSYLRVHKPLTIKFKRKTQS